MSSTTITAERRCPKHDEVMVLWRNGDSKPMSWRCRRCHAENSRRRYARLSARRRSKLFAQAVRHRLNAERLLGFASWLASSPGVAEAMTGSEKGRLALAYIEAAERQRDRAAEKQRRDTEARVQLDDPALQRQLTRLALAELRRSPGRVAEALADADPQAAADSLQARGWVVESPGA